MTDDENNISSDENQNNELSSDENSSDENENISNDNKKNKSEDPNDKLKRQQEEEGRFKQGQILRFVRVRFPGNAKSFRFFIGKRNFSYGQKVVAMSDRGIDIGYINSFPYDVEFNKSMLPIRSITKIATEEDLEKQRENKEKEKNAEIMCLRLIEKHNLNMIITHVEFIQFGKKAIFYFNAPERVDFRNLVKDLVTELKMRIELRQISVRDRSAAIGSISACGRQNCCSSFLKNYGNVSIKMAKNQSMALIPGKINGSCAQIKCCIRYENDVYSDKRHHLPREGSIIKTVNGDIGKVTKLILLKEQFEILTDSGKFCRYSASMFNKEINLPEGYKFPVTFNHIINDTKTLIDIKKPEETTNDNQIVNVKKNDLNPSQPSSNHVNTKNGQSSHNTNKSQNSSSVHKNKTQNSSQDGKKKYYKNRKQQ